MVSRHDDEKVYRILSLVPRLSTVVTRICLLSIHVVLDMGGLQTCIPEDTCILWATTRGRQE
jgi:hypothetical protein